MPYISRLDAQAAAAISHHFLARFIFHAAIITPARRKDVGWLDIIAAIHLQEAMGARSPISIITSPRPTYHALMLQYAAYYLLPLFRFAGLALRPGVYPCGITM